MNAIDVDCPACGAVAGAACFNVLTLQARAKAHTARRTEAAGAITICVPGRTNNDGTDTRPTYHAHTRSR